MAVAAVMAISPASWVVAGGGLARLRRHAVTGAPAAAARPRTLLILRRGIATSRSGVFLIAMIPARRWLVAPTEIKLGLWHLAVIGAVVGFITGIVSRPGRSRADLHDLWAGQGRLLSTEARGRSRSTSPGVTFQRFGALPLESSQGPDRGLSLMAGAFIAKALRLRSSNTSAC